MKQFIEELKRRNVVKVGIGYLLLGWVVLQVADVIVPAFELPDWTMKLLVIVGALGLPFALLLAWAYELTPEGLKRESEIDRSESIVAETGQRLNRIIIILLCIALSYFVYDKLFLVPESISTMSNDSLLELSTQKVNLAVAVIPFLNMSNDPEQDYFSDGITEELLNVLAKVSELGVASRTSSFQIKGQDLSIPEIAAKLKVRYLVEGSVRKAGDTIRITAQLIDADNDRHLWSDTYDRPLDVNNIFNIQDEITKAIVNAMSIELGFDTQQLDERIQSTDNLTAYELYLKSRSIFQSRSNLDEAEVLLARAVEIDPDYAEAWALRAANLIVAPTYGYIAEKFNDVDKLGMEYINRALSVNPNEVTAVAIKGLLMLLRQTRLEQDGNWDEMLGYFNKALELDPRNPQALNWMGIAYRYLGYSEQALKHFSQCIAIEPYYHPCMANQMGIYSAIGRDDIALGKYVENMDRGILIDSYAPISAIIRLNEPMIFLALFNKDDRLRGFDGQLRILEALLNLDKDHSSLVNELQTFLKTKKEVDHQVMSAILLPLSHDYTNSTGADSGRYWDPMMHQYRQSVYFKDFIRSTGILRYWHNHEFPPQCRPIGEDDFYCD